MLGNELPASVMPTELKLISKCRGVHHPQDSIFPMGHGLGVITRSLVPQKGEVLRDVEQLLYGVSEISH